MSGGQDQPAAFADDVDTLLHLGGDVLRGAIGERVLHVERAPERRPVSRYRFSFLAIVASFLYTISLEAKLHSV